MTGSDQTALFLAPTVPSSTGNGLAQRCQLFLNALARRFDVTVMVLPVAQLQTRIGTVARDHSGEGVTLDLTSVPGESARSTHLSLVSRMADPVERSAAFALYGLPSACGGLSDDCLAHCVKALVGQRFDHVHVMRSYCGPFGARLAAQLHEGGNMPVLTLDLDEDDAAFNAVLADHLAAMGQVTRSGMDSAWCRQEAAAFLKLQRDGLGDYQTMFASSALEAERLGAVIGKPVLVAQNVAHCPIVEPKLRGGGGSLLFVGDFAHVPNADGLGWFLDSVWPLLAKADVIRFELVGKNPPSGFARIADDPRIEIVGPVDSVLPYYAAADLVIAPLRLGAGTRIKLLEAARLGVPFVSTALAAEGLGMVDGRECWIADTPAEFAHCIEAALDDPAQRLSIAQSAQKLAVSHNTAEQVQAAISTTFAALHG